MAKYKTLDSVLEALANDRAVSKSDVSARVLRCKIWISGSGQPGCLYDYGPNYHRSKADAIADMAFVADNGEDGIPRGIVTGLRHDHSFYHCGIHYEISQDTLGSVL
jgi:hypothetical protein